MFRSSEGRRSGDSELSLERLSSHVQVLAERVDMLAQTVATIASAIAKEDGEIAVLRRELERDHERVEALVAEAHSAAGSPGDVRELGKRVTALAAEPARTSDGARIDGLDGKVVLLAERVDTLAATVASTAAGLVGRDGELASLRRRVEEGAQVRGSASVDESVRQRVDDLGAAIAAASMRIESQADQVASLRDALDAHDAELHTEIAKLAERLDSAEREPAALEASVAEAAATRWSELERTLTSLSERLDTVERERTESEARLARATSLWPAALRSLEARVEELSASAQTLPSRVSGAAHKPKGVPASDIARFLDEIRALEHRLESADADARREREELLLRLQRLETSRHAPDDEHLPVGADVLPFRSTET